MQDTYSADAQTRSQALFGTNRPRARRGAARAPTNARRTLLVRSCDHAGSTETNLHCSSRNGGCKMPLRGCGRWPVLGPSRVATADQQGVTNMPLPPTTSRVSIVCAGLMLSGSAMAHGGGLNAEGCHNDRKAGTYHCHRSPARAAPLAARLAAWQRPHRVDLQHLRPRCKGFSQPKNPHLQSADVHMRTARQRAQQALPLSGGATLATGRIWTATTTASGASSCWLARRHTLPLSAISATDPGESHQVRHPRFAQRCRTIE